MLNYGPAAAAVTTSIKYFDYHLPFLYIYFTVTLSTGLLSPTWNIAAIPQVLVNSSADEQATKDKC